jgi:tetratricopeptide (TPR) repeat protein
MSLASQPEISSPPATSTAGSARNPRWFIVLAVAALAYAFLAGLRTLTDADLGWQLSTGRWIVQHHQIPSVDVLSYTGAGQPWIYPVGSGLLFYEAYRLGNYALLCWIGAAACVVTTALLLRRSSAITAALATLAVPLIALSTTPRSNMFTVVLFAAFLSLLWEQHETGRARLWLLPVLMALWVNLHLGLASGLALIGGYVILEGLEMLRPERRKSSLQRLCQAGPWLIATFAATLLNPWGWRIYRQMFGMMGPMVSQSWIAEWAPLKLTLPTVLAGLSVRNPHSLIVLLLVAALAVPVALARRQFGAAVLLGGAAFLATRHMRLMALFAAVLVVIGGAVLTSAFDSWQQWMESGRVRSILAGGASCLLLLVVSLWSADLITNRAYLWRNDLASFGTGLSCWFPQAAASFVEREHIPGAIFNTYDEGGYLTWRLGPHYLDYVDGRNDPFPDLGRRAAILTGTSPDSPEWQREAERYHINAMVIPLARFHAADQFPVLKQFCDSQSWRPVYLDETSVVFIRRAPESENLIQRLQIDCETAPLPKIAPAGADLNAFNQWANSAVVLNALGRNQEALIATARALAIFPDNYYVHLTRAALLAQTGDLRDAEQHYLAATALVPNGLSWAKLADIYEQQHRLDAATKAWQHVIELDPDDSLAFLSLGDDYLLIGKPQEALKAYDRAAGSLKGLQNEEVTYADLAYGRAMAWKTLGDFNRAAPLQQEAARRWSQIAAHYEQQGRSADAQIARERAAALNGIP